MSILTPSPTRISMFRGDTHQVIVNVTKPDPSQPDDPDATLPVDLTGGTCVLSCKRRSTDASFLFQVSGTVTDGPNGQLTFVIGSGVTETVIPAIYSYDIQVTTQDSLVYTVLRDELLIKTNVNHLSNP